MRLKRFVAGALAMVLSFGMLSGCGKKVTVDEIMQKANEKSIETAKQIDTVFADSQLTYDEYKALMGLVPEGTYDVDMTGAGKVTLSQDGMSAEMSGNFNADFAVQIDADEMEMAVVGEFGYGYEALGSKGNQSMELGVYLVKEEDGYYFYMQSGSDPAVKEYVGDIEELFTEPLDVSEFLAEMNGETFEKQVQTQIEENPFKDKLVLQEETMKYDGKECYVIDFDITSEMIKEVLTTNEEFANSISESGMTFEEMLAEEITAGLTMDDIFNCMNFKCQYYYTTDDYSLVYFDMNMIDMAKALVDVVTKVLEAEQGISITADITELKMAYGCKEEAVDVKFDGEFVMADDEDDYDEPGIDLGENGTSSTVVSEIDFDTNVTLDIEQLTAVKMGNISGNVGKITIEEFESVGFVDYDGNKVKFEDGYFDGVADGYYVYSSESDGVVDEVLIEVDDDDISGVKLPKIDVYFTEYEIAVGQSVDVLAKLGEPALVDVDEDEIDYEWEIITEDLWYFLDVTTENGVITEISVYVF